MPRDGYNLSRLKIYDTSRFPKVNREQFLIKNHLQFLDEDLKPYERYIQFTEEYLEKAAIDFQKKHLKAADDEKLGWEICDKNINRTQEVDGDFTQRFRQSIIVQLYSFFEQALVSSCELYYSNKEIDKHDFDGLSNMAGFEEAKLFLKNHAMIELNALNQELDFLAKLTTLRNRIVHHRMTNFSDNKRDTNDIRALSKNRFRLMEKKDFTVTYSLYFDKPSFSFEIINMIKSLYKKLHHSGVYYL